MRPVPGAIFITRARPHPDNTIAPPRHRAVLRAYASERSDHPQQLSAGIGYRHEQWRIYAAYSVDLKAEQDVGESLIKSGE